MREHVSRQALQTATTKLAEARLPAQSGLVETEHTFSPAFEQSMEILIRRENEDQ